MPCAPVFLSISASIPADRRGDVLAHMLEFDHLMPRVISKSSVHWTLGTGQAPAARSLPGSGRGNL